MGDAGEILGKTVRGGPLRICDRCGLFNHYGIEFHIADQTEEIQNKLMSAALDS